ncbi:hypothetical protein Tco_0859439 [Tanacetum coccineum]|uniref:Uncharacterized protein n=1 Tax=Tanacetum coccineum TaxID=301880 RepID=A0ABQ5BF38_9ASTR
MNQNFNYSNSFGLDQIQPPQFSTVQLLEIERINKEESFKKKDMSIEEIMSEKRLIDDEIKDITNDLSYKRFRGEKIDDEYARDWGMTNEDDYIPLRDIIARYSPSVAITSSPPVLPTREPEDSLIIGDEHLDTIPEKESDELIKSSIENLIPIPSESEVTSDNESECDMPVCDDFTTFSNPLFDSNDNFTSSDDESLFDEDFDISFEEFSGELAHIDPIPPRIEKADFDLEEEIRLVENLLYDNSSPRPQEELNLENVDTIIDSLSPSPIPVCGLDDHLGRRSIL